jgi:hypothetical protein
MRSRSTRPSRLGGPLALALALLLAQWLALAHGVLHPGGGAARSALASATEADSPGWASLFGKHDGGDGAAQCRLVDQLPGGLLVAPALPPLAALPQALLRAPLFANVWQGLQALGFRARAPPVLA